MLCLLLIPFYLIPGIPHKVGSFSPSKSSQNTQAGVSLGDRDRLREVLQYGLLMSCEFATIDPAVGF